MELRSEQGVAHGQNQNLEKDYLRLTSLPRLVGMAGRQAAVAGMRILRMCAAACCMHASTHPPKPAGNTCSAAGVQPPEGSPQP